MQTVIQTMGMLSVIALGTAATGCAPSTAASDPVSHQASTDVSPSGAAAGVRALPSTTEAKPSAPVEVTLTSSAKSGTVVITLSLKAQVDIPGGVGRIVLPKEVRLVSGQTQVDLGALKRGVVSQFQVTVEIPSTGQFRIFGGVDCHISSGILMHKGAQELGFGQ